MPLEVEINYPQYATRVPWLFRTRRSIPSHLSSSRFPNSHGPQKTLEGGGAFLPSVLVLSPSSSLSLSSPRRWRYLLPLPAGSKAADEPAVRPPLADRLGVCTSSSSRWAPGSYSPGTPSPLPSTTSPTSTQAPPSTVSSPSPTCSPASSRCSSSCSASPSPAPRPGSTWASPSLHSQGCAASWMPWCRQESSGSPASCPSSTCRLWSPEPPPRVYCVLVSAIRVITKAIYLQDAHGIRQTVILYFIVGIVLMVICIVCYNVADRHPVVTYYKNIKRRAQKAEEGGGMTESAWRSTLWSIVGSDLSADYPRSQGCAHTSLRDRRDRDSVVPCEWAGHWFFCCLVLGHLMMRDMSSRVFMSMYHSAMFKASFACCCFSCSPKGQGYVTC